ncbi:MAG: hypothetical protein A2Z25_08740 [Planctomycetes bacterium RBG_16_55_9]|nr:MAG: hypothetical protein A2Z25_08740 [Planctomycetes bacterium RBG_16_55_9]
MILLRKFKQKSCYCDAPRGGQCNLMSLTRSNAGAQEERNVRTPHYSSYAPGYFLLSISLSHKSIKVKTSWDYRMGKDWSFPMVGIAGAKTAKFSDDEGT